MESWLDFLVELFRNPARIELWRDQGEVGQVATVCMMAGAILGGMAGVAIGAISGLSAPDVALCYIAGGWAVSGGLLGLLLLRQIITPVLDQID